MAQEILFTRTTRDELLAEISAIINETIQRVLIQNPKKKELLTAAETVEMLNITHPTLNNWVKRGMITKIKVGGHRIAFRTTDVEKLLRKVETSKH
jgi:excisionase family DNA binding protein